MDGTAVPDAVIRQWQLRAALVRAIQLCAALDRILAMSVAQATERTQFGRPLAKFQAVQNLVADIAAETALARAATDGALAEVLRTGWLSDALEFLVAMALSCAGQAASAAVRNAHQVHGAIGTTREHRLHEFTTPALSWRSEYGSVTALGRQAVEAGMDMALACDLRLTSTRARFSEGYVRVGLIPGDGGAHLLPRIVGQARALELLWTGRFVEALALGLVLSVHTPEEFKAAVDDLCSKLAAGPPLAIRAIKRLVRNGERVDCATSLSMVAAEQAVVQSTADSAEAAAAFRERRAPVFQGR